MKTSIIARSLFGGVLLSLIQWPAAAVAQTGNELATAPQSDTADKNDSAGRDVVVVTATRVATEVDKVGYSLTVFDEIDIERSQSALLTDLLVQVPGVTMTRVGGAGQSSSVRIRGGDSDHVVLVIDGVKMTDPSTTGGGSDFSEIMIGDIARVEVLRGPQSTLWGSQAISGIVNVVTATPSEPFEGKFLLEAGSRETVNARLGVGGKTGALSWRLAGNHYETEGISSLDERLGGVEPDGHRNNTFSGRATYDLSDAMSVDLRGFYADAKTDLDNVSGRRDSPAYTLSRQLTGYAGLNFDLLSGRLKNRVSYQYTDTDGSRVDPSLAVPVTRDTIGRTKRAEYQGILSIQDGANLAFGAETQDTYVRYRSPTVAIPNPAARVNDIGLDSVYGQLQLEPFENVTLTGGLRYDDHQNFGGHTNGQMSVIWRPNDGDTLLRASWGQGFNAPTAYQLFDARYGNTQVEPEEAKGSWDASIEHHLLDGRLSLVAGYFNARTRNLIVVTNCTAAPTSVHCLGTGRPGFYSNVDRAKADGVELQAALRIDSTNIVANYTYTKARDLNNGRDLARTPRDTANITIDHNWTKRLQTGLTARYVGASFNDAANSVTLDEYILVNARVSFDLTDNLSIFGRVDNLFDEYYVTNLNYGTEGRAYHAGLRSTF